MVALALDRADRRKHGPEQVLEGAPSGAYWEAAASGGTKWLELDWRFPEPVVGVTFRVAEPGLCRKIGVEMMDLASGQWREVAKEVAGVERNAVEFREPVEASRLRLVFDMGAQPASGAKLRVGEVRVFSKGAPLLRPDWSAKWIWGGSKDGKKEATVWLRRSFEVADLSSLESAWLQCAADDFAGVHLNGVPVGKVAGVRPQIFDLKPHLLAGRNVLAVDLRDTGGAYGFLGEVCLNFRTREGKVSSQKISTNEEWKATEILVAGWPKTDFDDSGWSSAVELYHRADEGPWGGVAYEERALPEDRMVIRAGAFSPQEVKPGSWVEVAFQLVAERALSEDYRFEVALQAGPEGAFDNRVAKGVLQPEVPTSQWEPGEVQQLRGRLWIGDFAPQGEVRGVVQAFAGGKMAKISSAKESGPVVPALQVARMKKTPAVGVLPRVEVRPLGDGQALYVNDKPVPPVVMTQFDVSNRALAAYAEGGFEIFRLGTSGRILTVPEDQEEAYVAWFKRFDDHVQRLDAYAPECWLMVSVMLRVTPEWVARYPSEAYVTGSRQRGRSHSMASEQWRKDSAQAIRRLVAHIEAQPWGRRVIGYTFMAGGGGEFHQYGPEMKMAPRAKAFIGDFSKAALSSFRQWLEKRYNGDVAALREAWKREGLEFSTLEPTNAHLVAQGEYGFFRDPVVAQEMIDYFLWYNERNAENLVYFCEVGREAASAKPIFGGYYGYLVSKMLSQKPGDNHLGGHNALDWLLKSKAVDFVSLPYSYSDRMGGTPFFQNTPQRSVALNGKLFLAEYDNRTFSSGLRDYPQSSLAETLAIQRRDIGAGVATGAGWWWLDFSRGSTGQQSVPWFSHPEVVHDMRRGISLYREVYSRPLKGSAEVAVLVDGRSSMLLDIYASIPAYNLIKRAMIRETSSIGAPVDYLNLADLEKPEVQQQYKVYVFLNAYHLDAAQRELVRTRLQRDGKTLVWLWAPGISGYGKGLGVEGLADITGMKFEGSTQWANPTIDLAKEEGLRKPLVLEDWDISFFRNRPFYEKRLAPRFWPVEDGLKVLGRWREDGKPGVAEKVFAQWRSVYVGTPYLSAELLRHIVRDAGVHLYTDGEVASLHVGNGVISIHATREQAFRGELRWKGLALPVDAFTEKPLAQEPVESIHLRLLPGETQTVILKDAGAQGAAR